MVEEAPYVLRRLKRQKANNMVSRQKATNNDMSMQSTCEKGGVILELITEVHSNTREGEMKLLVDPAQLYH